MNPMLDLGLQASSQLWNPLVTKGSNIELNPLSHTHRNSPECWEIDKKMQNEPSIGGGTSGIKPTWEPPHYRGLQPRAHFIEPHA
jgi:hypothetical protein